MHLEGFGLRRLTEFLPLAELSVMAFAARVPHPVLLMKLSKELLYKNDHSGTMNVSLLHPDGDSEEFIVPLARKGAEGTPQPLSIGRAFTSDVVLPFETVSRCHAMFSRSPTGECFLTDQASKNGTWLNTQRLNAHQSFPLKDGDTLRFGDAEGRFLTPESFQKVLAQLWG